MDHLSGFEDVDFKPPWKMNIWLKKCIRFFESVIHKAYLPIYLQPPYLAFPEFSSYINISGSSTTRHFIIMIRHSERLHFALLFVTPRLAYVSLAILFLHVTM